MRQDEDLALCAIAVEPVVLVLNAAGVVDDADGLIRPEPVHTGPVASPRRRVRVAGVFFAGQAPVPFP